MPSFSPFVVAVHFIIWPFRSSRYTFRFNYLPFHLLSGIRLTENFSNSNFVPRRNCYASLVIKVRCSRYFRLPRQWVFILDLLNFSMLFRYFALSFRFSLANALQARESNSWPGSLRYTPVSLPKSADASFCLNFAELICGA